MTAKEPGHSNLFVFLCLLWLKIFVATARQRPKPLR
jgi:uncharacterized membrane protein